MSEKVDSAATYSVGGGGLVVGAHDGGIAGLLHIQDITDILNLILVVASLILVFYRLYHDIKKPK